MNDARNAEITILSTMLSRTALRRPASQTSPPPSRLPATSSLTWTCPKSPYRRPRRAPEYRDFQPTAKTPSVQSLSNAERRGRTAITGPQRLNSTINDALNQTPAPTMKQIASAVSLGGNSKTSNPSQWRNGIGIQRNSSVMIPIAVVIEFECKRKVSVVAATGGGRNDEMDEPSACLYEVGGGYGG